MRGHDPMNEEEMIGIVGKLADAGDSLGARRCFTASLTPCAGGDLPPAIKSFLL
jgi:hypothetical protein